MIGKPMLTDLTEFRPEHWASLLELYRRYFGDWSARRFEERWVWQYESNPYCSERSAFIQVGLLGEEVVAHMGAFPIPCRFAGLRQMALCGADLVVDERCRWVALQLFEDFAKRAPVIGSGMTPATQKLFQHFGGGVLPQSRQRFIYRLCYRGVISRRIRSSLPLRFGWLVSPKAIGLLAPSRAVGLAIRYVAPHEAAEIKPVLDASISADIRPIRRFGEAYDALWQIASRRFCHSVDKTSSYLNWRYLACPTMSPLCLGLYDGRDALSGVVVAASYVLADRHRRPCGTEGEILELITEDLSAHIVEELIRAAIGGLARAGVDSVCATGLHVGYHPMLAKIGFVHQDSARFVLALRLDAPEVQEACLSDGEDWYSTAGDGDALYGAAI